MVSGEPAGTDLGNVAGFIKQLISVGEGPTAGLQIFRDAGGEIRNQSWFQLYASTNAALIDSPAAAALDAYTLPPGTAYDEWQMGRGDQYATQVKVFFVDRDSGVVGSAPYTYITDDPHTPAEAESAAFDAYANPDNQSQYGQTVQGTMTTNIFHTVRWGG